MSNAKKMISQKQVEKVHQIVEPRYKKIRCWVHSWLHVKEVVKAARVLAEMEGEDVNACLVAAYCHDLGRLAGEERGPVPKILGDKGHAALSVEPTKEVLATVGIGGKTAKEITEAVAVHSIKKYTGPNKIARILQDADRKNGLGKWGFVRAVKFFTKIKLGQVTEKTDLEVLVKKSYQLLIQNPADIKTVIGVLKFTLEWYDELLNTEAAREYLKGDYLFTKRMLVRLEKV